MKTILFSGGGTLGHILPNIVLAKMLMQNNFIVKYIGEDNSMEQRVCKQNHIPFYTISAVKFDRYNKLSNVKIPIKLPSSISETKAIIKRIKPDLIFTKGGYVSLPVVIAGKMMNIPEICHESDATLGIVNKIAYKLGAEVLTSYNCDFEKGKKVGIPLKNELFSPKSNNLPVKFNNTRPTILVTGGSQGARRINEFFLENLDKILAKYNLIIIGGKTLDLSIKRPNLYLTDFTDKMEDFYKISDIVVSRAGATTIAEIIALNKKAILIPLPTDVSRGDQIQNAKNVESKTIKTIPQDKLNIDDFLKTVAELQKATPTEKKFVNPSETIYKIIVNYFE